MHPMEYWLSAFVLRSWRRGKPTVPTHTHIQPTKRKHSYKHLVGKSVVVPMSGGREVPIIADTYVDMAFGTGALKITPGEFPFFFYLRIILCVHQTYKAHARTDRIPPTPLGRQTGHDPNDSRSNTNRTGGGSRN